MKYFTNIKYYKVYSPFDISNYERLFYIALPQVKKPFIVQNIKGWIYFIIFNICKTFHMEKLSNKNPTTSHELTHKIQIN